MTTKNTYKLTTSAALVALSTALSLIKVWQMPLGGAVTALSMVPICLISVMYGTRYAILPCFIYGIIQMFVSNPFSWGLTPTILVGCIVFDYILAFASLSLAGIFRSHGDNGIVGGVFIACLARFICHFISGCVFFSNLEQWSFLGTVFTNHPILYSFCYNGFYMLPELLLTIVGILILSKTGATKHIFKISLGK